MSPQFVDYDHDGKLDIVCGVYDGSPYVALGGEKGFKQPVGILDKNGDRIVLNAFWNYETKKWDETQRCNPKDSGDDVRAAHGTSAYAFDADGDDDHDLLLGDYQGGRLYWRENEGSAEKAAFAVRNRHVTANGKPIVVEGGLATMRLIDWNGDGRLDLLCGSMGDTWGAELGGGIYLYPGIADSSPAAYGAPVTLVAPHTKAFDKLMGPDAGYYMDAGDLDGDGDLDLIVGAYSMWTPPSRQLDEAEKARVDEINKSMANVTIKEGKLNAELMAIEEKGLDEAALEKKRDAVLATQAEARQELYKERTRLTKELDKLVPQQQRHSYVWWFENDTHQHKD